MRYWLLILFLKNAYLLVAQNDIALLIQKTAQIRPDSNLVKVYHNIGEIYLDEKKLSDSATFYFQYIFLCFFEFLGIFMQRNYPFCCAFLRICMRI